MTKKQYYRMLETEYAFTYYRNEIEMITKLPMVTTHFKQRLYEIFITGIKDWENEKKIIGYITPLEAVQLRTTIEFIEKQEPRNQANRIYKDIHERLDKFIETFHPEAVQKHDDDMRSRAARRGNEVEDPDGMER